jgi:hypothetical protein
MRRTGSGRASTSTQYARQGATELKFFISPGAR